MSARPFALVRAHAATLDGPLGDDLRALLAAWDAEHPGAVGERYLASGGDSVWTVAEERGDDFVLRGARGACRGGSTSAGSQGTTEEGIEETTMGQMTMGIMWGVRVPKGVRLWNDEDSTGLLDHWCEACREEIDKHDDARSAWVTAKPGRMPYQRICGRRRYVPDYEPDAGVCGFWIAVGAGGKDGLPSLDEWQSPGYTPVEMTRAGVKLAFPKAYRNAVARWARFRRWCDDHADLDGAERFAVTAPSLWLVPTEVA